MAKTYMTEKSFTVRIEPSGHEFVVAAGETILDAALKAGFTLPYSCRNGSCGACKGKVLRGSVDYGVYEDKALSVDERGAGNALFCQAQPLSDVVIEAKEVAIAPGIAIKMLPARVVKMERVAHDVMVLSLRLPANQEFKFVAGQYIDILLKDGQRRSFSLANPPEQTEALQLHVRHVPGGAFTGHVFTEMKEKDLLRFRGPLGIFFLREESPRPIIFIAGGTGFAPINALLEHAFAVGIARPMHLYWGARRPGDLYMHERAQAWTNTHPHFRYTPVLSHVEAVDAWPGRRGWVHEAVLADYPQLSSHDVYASGPPPLIDAVRTELARHGLPRDRLYFDSFEFAHAL